MANTDARAMSELDHDHDHSSEEPDDLDNAKKPGRKQNPDAQQQRRIQNRVAQREFRLRKQQRIRDLEARVEMLSAGQGQGYEQMRNILRAIMAENHHLRGIIRQLTEFMAEGVGGCLPKMGYTKESFDELVNRGETDTAFYAYDAYKKSRGSSQPGSGNLPQLSAILPEAGDGPNKKRKRAETDTTEDVNSNDTPSTSPPIASNLTYTTNGVSSPNAMQTFSALLDGGYSGQSYNTSQSLSNSQMRANTVPQYGLQNESMIPRNSNIFGAFNGYETYNLPPPPPPQEPQLMQLARDSAENTMLLNNVETAIEAANPRQLEAGKLIKYHLSNYRNNHNYCLPIALRPTLVQRTIAHGTSQNSVSQFPSPAPTPVPFAISSPSSFSAPSSSAASIIFSAPSPASLRHPIIDGIPAPVMRDRMILLKGRYDLVDCMHEFLKGITIHGDDVLAYTNWEVSEVWLKKYGFLVDEATVTAINRWRKERGEREIMYEDLPTMEEQPQMPVQPYGAGQQTIGSI
ncbi:hypothetical protein DACRYDRAFT_111635 [Dacryopinax primogenitus]|uniref:BZIP domain-containing protein n=1 Tax=Dacryopinax primogenitus (strain DJM 731) TaxID=1858805 RepID=M5FRH9_DACPD|nr:uncharacterized protein DACRYDRAFT_111635 [Dacryopinax primogenitus]EJT97594.1 hypothetical protein DACRYDRAFT_111635 [Dacryopinax primogenitus]